MNQQKKTSPFRYAVGMFGTSIPINMFKTYAAAFYVIGHGVTTAQFSMVLFLVLVYGNAAPKLPFNRHLGLRLPWTTADENTWRYAHRICGYMSFPTAFFMLCGYAMHHTGVQAAAFGFGFVGIPAFLSYRYDQKQKKDRI